MSQIKLNLGCGVFPFPYERGQEPNPEHILPLPDICYEPGWINVDKHPADGIQEQIDLFRFPWVRSSNGSPFSDNSIDAIWAAHLVEHIPHEVRLHHTAHGLQPWDDWVSNLDGFFVFFAEAWRILRPGGLIHLRFPYAACYASLSDPTHTRYLTPGSLSYLGARDDNTPFDYAVPCRFKVVGNSTFRLLDEGQWLPQFETPIGMQRELQRHYYLADEVRIVLEAVKE